MPAPSPAPESPGSLILLIGATGQVGWELLRTLQPLGRIAAAGRQLTPGAETLRLDLSEPESIRAVVREARPELIVNAAAYTAVDKAEEEPDLAMATNATGPAVLAEEAKRLGAALVHYSTDYVFEGTKATPYTEEDEPRPLNVYGKTKLEGERAIQAAGVPHLILRTSWVYGGRGRNFLLTILRLAREREELRVVNDQVGAPTWSRMVAEATAQVLARCRQASALAERGGLYHLTASGQTSWHGFAQAIVSELSAKPSTPPLRLQASQILPIGSAEYPTAARRPAYSVLSNDKLAAAFGLRLPDWRTQLSLALDKGRAAGAPCS